jgi:phosphoribosylamine--glycine ligase
MGAYSPAPVVDEAMHERIMQQVMLPTVQGLTKDGIHYTGFLYAGLMIDSNGVPNVIEFNCRFGDPEAQPIMMRLKSDLVELCLAAVNGDLHHKKIQWDENAALGVVLAAHGYPESYAKGMVISGLEDCANTGDTKVFHAGTASDGDQVITSGGRVLCVTALGGSVRDARQNAYHAVENIAFDGVFYRRDIGYRALDRESV